MHQTLVVVVSSVNGNVGLTDPFRLIVEGFIDTQFTEPGAVPEPATMLLVASGLAIAVSRRRTR